MADMTMTINAKDKKAGMGGEELLEIIQDTRNASGAVCSRVKATIGWHQQVQAVTLVWE